MSLTALIALNAVIDLAVIGGVAWLMLVPFRLDRAPAAAEPIVELVQPDELSRAA